MKRKSRFDGANMAERDFSKLLWAGINLTSTDLLFDDASHSSTTQAFYPIEMVRALAITWLIGGLSQGDLYRLQVGCIRWQQADNKSEVERICLLDIPHSKTNPALTKSVDRIVGQAIEVWQEAKLAMPSAMESETGEHANLLFSYRGKRITRDYINNQLIPLLCRKAGIPESDAQGRITRQRIQGAIAYQQMHVYETPTLMILTELQEWLGHRQPNTN